MKILIIYEEVPEATKFYVARVTSEEWLWMRTTHARFLGSDNENQACRDLILWLQDHKPFEPVEPILLRGGDFDYVLYTGLMM